VLKVYEAASGAPVHSPELSGVAQVALFPGGDFVAGLKHRLVFGGASPLEVPFAEGTLESLCASPSGEFLLVSLEEPNALELVAWGHRGGERVRLPHEDEAHELVLWSPRGPLAVSREGVQALEVVGGALQLRGAIFPLGRFADPAVGMMWGGSVVLGNVPGQIIVVDLDSAGLPVRYAELTRQASVSQVMRVRAHTERVHTFLEGRDPPQVVSVAGTHGDPSQNGALARWSRSSRGVWAYTGDLVVPPGQLSVTQGGLEREWVAVARLRSSGAIVLEQTPSARFLRR
tara:strand:- start:15 stop:878 length:864 start_codon:yes stop_codon:yes gene_type:complete